MIYKFTINHEQMITVSGASDIWDAFTTAESIYPNEVIRIYSITKL